MKFLKHMKRVNLHILLLEFHFIHKNLVQIPRNRPCLPDQIKMLHGLRFNNNVRTDNQVIDQYLIKLICFTVHKSN